MGTKSEVIALHIQHRIYRLNSSSVNLSGFLYVLVEDEDQFDNDGNQGAIVEDETFEDDDQTDVEDEGVFNDDEQQNNVEDEDVVMMVIRAFQYRLAGDITVLVMLMLTVQFLFRFNPFAVPAILVVFFGYRTLCVRSFCKERKFAMKNKRKWKSLNRRGLAASTTSLSASSAASSTGGVQLQKPSAALKQSSPCSCRQSKTGSPGA